MSIPIWSHCNLNCTPSQVGDNNDQLWDFRVLPASPSLVNSIPLFQPVHVGGTWLHDATCVNVLVSNKVKHKQFQKMLAVIALLYVYCSAIVQSGKFHEWSKTRWTVGQIWNGATKGPWTFSPGSCPVQCIFFFPTWNCNIHGSIGVFPPFPYMFLSINGLV